MFLYLVCLISNIGLLTAEVLPGEPRKQAPKKAEIVYEDIAVVVEVALLDLC